MILEARLEHCLSRRLLLLLDGRPHGILQERFLLGGVDVELTGRRRLRFQKVSWFRKRFVLTALDAAEPLGRAEDESLLGGYLWDLDLSVGRVRMEPAGLFGSDSVVMRQDRVHARVDRLRGWCSTGWQVEAEGGASSETDLLLIGLAYNASRRRGGGPK